METQEESIIDRFRSKLFTKIDLCSASEACQTEAVVFERFWGLDSSVWKQFVFKQVEKTIFSYSLIYFFVLRELPHLLSFQTKLFFFFCEIRLLCTENIR